MSDDVVARLRQLGKQFHATDEDIDVSGCDLDLQSVQMADETIVDSIAEINRLRDELASMTDKFNRLKDAIPTTDEITTPDFLATVEGAWSLEWSQSQRQWHVGLMARTITRNRRAFLNGKPNDYVIIAIYPTASECSAVRRYLDEGREAIDSKDDDTEEQP